MRPLGRIVTVYLNNHFEDFSEIWYEVGANSMGVFLNKLLFS